jgi:hypothetical protein
MLPPLIESLMISDIKLTTKGKGWKKALPFPVVSTRRVSDIGQPQLNLLKSKPRNGKGKIELHRVVITANHERLTELL